MIEPQNPQCVQTSVSGSVILPNELRVGNTIEYFIETDNLGWQKTTVDWQDIKWCSEQNESFNELTRSDLKKIGDLERLISKVVTYRVNPREMVQLGRSLECIKGLKETFAKSASGSIKKIADTLNNCELLLEKLKSTLHEDPPVALNKGNVIAKGVSSERCLDISIIAHNSNTFANKSTIMQPEGKHCSRAGHESNDSASICNQ